MATSKSAKAPKATILLTGVSPRNDHIGVMPVIDRVNEKLAKLADEHGKLWVGVMNADQLPPAIPGYRIWAESLSIPCSWNC